MIKQLHFDCSSGASGDMLVASLLDAGASGKKVCQVLQTIPARGFEIKITKVNKNNIIATDFDVVLEEDNHDHDMQYLHGEDYVPKHEESHQPHRNLSMVMEIIDNTKMSANAKAIAKGIFEIVANAEAKVHQKQLNEVHFHEVGALDSIADIIALAVCIDDISPDKITMDGLIEGCGTIRCMHGILDVPVPAVREITSTYAIPYEQTTIKGELVTPTGAAALAYLCDFEKKPLEYKVLSTGYGAGKREYECAGIVSASVLLVE